MVRSPAQLLGQSRGVRAENGRVTQPPRRFSDRNLPLRYLLCKLQHFLDRMARASTNVVNVEPSRFHPLYGKNMGFGDVDHMYIIAKTSSVFRCVISSIDLEVRPAPRSNLEKQGNDVSLGIVTFAPFGCSPACVEVAECDDVPTVRGGVASQDIFKHQLAFSVRVHRILRMILRNRNLLGIAVNCRYGGKDKLSDALLANCLEHRDATGNICIEKNARISYRLWNQGFGSKMEYAIESLGDQKIG